MNTNTIIVVAVNNEYATVKNYVGFTNGFYKEETMRIDEILEIVFGHYIFGDIQSKNELQELIDYHTQYGYEYIEVPYRGEHSQFSYSASQHLNLFRLAKANQEFYEFCIELLGQNESDYVYMVAMSGLKAVQEGIDPFDVEPWAHTVYITGGGHITTRLYTIPYILFKIYGAISSEKIQKAKDFGIERTGDVSLLLCETEWSRIKYMKLTKQQDGALAHFFEWYYYDCESVWDKKNRFSSLEGLKRFLKLYDKYVRFNDNWDWEYKDKVVRSIYDKYGDYIPMERKFYENLLEYEFKKIYGRTPRCIRLLSALYYHGGYDNIRKIVDNFNFRVINNLKKKMSFECAIRCCVEGLDIPWASTGMALCLLECNSKEAVNWTLAHKDTDAKILCHVLSHPELYDLSLNIDAIKQKYELLNGSGYLDFIKYKDSIPERQAPDMPIVSVDGIDAYCLDLSTDVGLLQAFGLGYDTHCCQHVDGAGETAMFYSLKYGEFLVFKKNGKLLAQAACWTAQSGEFVLDNIEFTNNRDASEIVPALSRWCALLHNKDVLMGTGYNALTLGLKEKKSESIGLIQPKYDMGYIYTDTAHIVELKKRGEVLI